MVDLIFFLVGVEDSQNRGAIFLKIYHPPIRDLLASFSFYLTTTSKPLLASIFHKKIMKRPLDTTNTTTKAEPPSSPSSPPTKSQRMGSAITCPKKDNENEERNKMDDQVEKMDAVATGEGTLLSEF